MFEKSRYNIGDNISKSLADTLGPEGTWQWLMNSATLAHENPKLRAIISTAIQALCGDMPQGISTEMWGKTYKSPTGLGPGIIKEHMAALDIFSEFPFGFMTIGGITGVSQPGNAIPRIWRNNDQSSVINAMGLPGPGIDNVVSQLESLRQKKRLPDILWANLCNSLSTTTDENKVGEFKMMVEKIWPYVDVIELNFSCPNQHGVADGIQKSERLLGDIIQAAQISNENMAQGGGTKKPILVKIGPVRPDISEPDNTNNDLSFEELQMIVGVCQRYNVEGIVATNTAKNHNGYTNPIGKGGMSGRLLYDRTRNTIIRIQHILGDNSDMQIIGAGGVGTGTTLKSVQDTGIGLLNAGANIQYMVSGFTLNPASIGIVNRSIQESIGNK